MMSKHGLHLLGLTMLLSLAINAQAEDSSYHQTVDGVAIYIGVVPAEVVRGRPPEHPEGEMHGGPRFNESHLTVALFDAKSGERIREAEIRATVTDYRGPAIAQKLEPMLIAGSLTYGNYFPMAGTGPYRIELVIQVPGRKRPVEASFKWARS